MNPTAIVPELDPGYPFVSERMEPECADPSGHLWAAMRTYGGFPEIRNAEPTSKCTVINVLTGRRASRDRWDAWCESFGSIISSYCVQPGCNATRRRVIDFARRGEPEGDYMVYGYGTRRMGA